MVVCNHINAVQAAGFKGFSLGQVRRIIARFRWV